MAVISSSAASRRNVAMRSSGIFASCSAVPVAGSTLHRGIAVNPPLRSTPRQNSRSAARSSPRLTTALTSITSFPPLTLWLGLVGTDQS